MPLVLGPQWGDAVPLFYILGFSSVAIVLSGLQFSLLIAHRENSFILRQSVVSTVIIAVILYAGVQEGLKLTLILYITFCYARSCFSINMPLRA